MGDERGLGNHQDDSVDKAVICCRRNVGEGVEFVSIIIWEWLDAIRFAVKSFLNHRGNGATETSGSLGSPNGPAAPRVCAGRIECAGRKMSAFCIRNCAHFLPALSKRRRPDRCLTAGDAAGHSHQEKLRSSVTLWLIFF
jgi:hypothetical protein